MGLLALGSQLPAASARKKGGECGWLPLLRRPGSSYVSGKSEGWGRQCSVTSVCVAGDASFWMLPAAGVCGYISVLPACSVCSCEGLPAKVTVSSTYLSVGLCVSVHTPVSLCLWGSWEQTCPYLFFPPCLRGLLGSVGPHGSAMTLSVIFCCYRGCAWPGLCPSCFQLSQVLPGPQRPIGGVRDSQTR